MGIPTQLAVGYIGKQSVKGTPVTPPAFIFPLEGGKPFDHEITQEVVPLTGITPGLGDIDRTMVIPRANHETLGFPRSVGAFLFAMLGADVVTGTNPNYIHTMSPVNEPLPWMTLWGRMGTDYVRIQDAKPDELTISWDGSGLIHVAVGWMGITSTWAITPSAATVDDTAGGLSKLRAAGGTFRLDVDGTTLATACIKAGKVTMRRNLTADPCAASISPNDLTSGRFEAEWSLTLTPATDLVDLRTIVTGTPAGTAPTGTPVYGSAEAIFTIDANTSLELQSDRIAYVAETPAADPEGASAELVLEGNALQPTGGNIIDVVLKNAVALY